MYLPKPVAFKKWIKEKLLEANFDKDIVKRFGLVGEIEKYKDDKELWTRSNTEKNIVEVYFDGNFICDLDEGWTKKKVIYRFWSTFRDKYKDGTISLIRN